MSLPVDRPSQARISARATVLTMRSDTNIVIQPRPFAGLQKTKQKTINVEVVIFIWRSNNCSNINHISARAEVKTFPPISFLSHKQ